MKLTQNLIGYFEIKLLLLGRKKNADYFGS